MASDWIASLPISEVIASALLSDNAGSQLESIKSLASRLDTPDAMASHLRGQHLEAKLAALLQPAYPRRGSNRGLAV